MTVPNSATLAQMQAADPAYSVWLSANAGSGKTKVLTDRVARLLLEGVRPERILCLTYTKAAASEMQNRLFRTLGGWSMLEDEDLRSRLRDLGLEAREVTPDLCRQARTLFARAIETPGGLKIQTIHSFCAGLLRRFPMEAGVSPNFTEMDNRAGAELRREVLRDMATGPDRQILFDLSRDVDETTLPGLIQELLTHRTWFDAPPDPVAVAAELGLSPDMTLESLVAETVLPDDPALLSRLREVCAHGSTTDQRAAAKLAEILDQLPGLGWLAPLEALLLHGESAKKSGPFTAKIDAFPTKASREALEGDQTALNDLMERIERARDTRLALGVAEMTHRVHAFGHAFIRRYQAGKQARGWLDFDDLILRAQGLLTDPGVAQWVLFRLDGGIDHMLVDEAQDTSPVQWEVIRLLTREFTTGQGARSDVHRTIFVVGDQKQSIYSFQGADPAGFDRMRAHFGTELAQVGTPLEEKLLLYSFRSSRAVLRLVDDTFARIGHQGLGGGSEHLAFHDLLPGRVDLWPALPKSEGDDPQDWTDPVDAIAKDDARLILARNIAAEIKRILDGGTQIITAQGEVRPVSPGDFLILVQRRSEMFHELIRACKSADLAIAGTDRLRVGAELAVKDLMALLAFAATPEDSLALACVLRSPLCGWSEAQLHALAQPRTELHLWAALRATADQNPETAALLQDIRDQADFLRPYDLLERALTRHGGREALIARLGAEAEEGIDALLAQALHYEQTEIPSLTGFVTWFRQDDMEIKRQIDSSRDEIRVMTVHGAKGLEAPIVILPDCAKTTGRSGSGSLLTTEDGLPIWSGSAATRPARSRALAAAAAQRQQEERLRLLYVAMTRAESWLIVAAAGETGKAAESWHAIVSAGMAEGETDALPCPSGDGLRLSHGVWPAPVKQASTAAAPQTHLVPEFAPLPPQPIAPVLRAPSDLGGAKILADAEDGLDRDAAMKRGDQIHLLLEHLPAIPRGEWAAQTEKLLSHSATTSDPIPYAELLAEAAQVLNNPALAHLFTEDSLAEADITAPVPGLGGDQILGTIDRLIVEPDRILAVDFKTNAAVPTDPGQVPEGLLRQMGAYLQALQRIWPDRAVEVAILWTRTATLMPLPHGLVIAALQNSTPA